MLEWWHEDGRTGICDISGDAIPQGATIGLHPNKVRRLRFNEKIARLKEISACIQALKSISKDNDNNRLYMEAIDKYNRCLKETSEVDLDDMSGDFEFPDIPELKI